MTIGQVYCGGNSASVAITMTKRARGTIYKQPGCSTWTVQYFQSGRRVREASGSEDYRAAQQLLTKRLAAVDAGEVIESLRKRAPVSELWEGLVMDYRINDRKSAKYLKYRWTHLSPVFGNMPAANVSHDAVQRYICTRIEEGASNATVNRELSALKRALRLGCRNQKVRVMPFLPAKLKESNVRQGFIEDAAFDKLVANCSEPWLRLFLEIGYSYGWRKAEILNLRCGQVSIEAQTIRLDPGTTKNDEGRQVSMTVRICALVRCAVQGKSKDDFLLTRPNGKPVRSFRGSWSNLTKAALEGTLVHDLRRSGARQMRQAGVPESIVQKIGGWKTRAMFERYAIVDNADMKRATVQLEEFRAAALLARENSHDSSHDSTEESAAGAGGEPGRPN
jgi:integrase